MQCPACKAETKGRKNNPNACGHCGKRLNVIIEVNTIATSFPLKPVAPFSVPVAKPAYNATNTTTTKAVIFGDTHIGFQDDAALAIVERIIVEEKPDILVHVGDLIDAGVISLKFPTDPSRLDTLQDDIDHARRKLHQWAQLAPQAERWLLEGNHEQRLTRLIWGLQGAARELPKLKVFQHNMSWPVLLGLDQIGWNWVSYDDQPREDILPKLLVKHGDVIRKYAGWTAKGEWEKSGKSGISGHTHRAAVWCHKDYNGTARWIETGCTCKLDGTPGANSPDWQQAVTVIEWNEDKSLMDVRQTLIRDGVALHNGEEIDGR